MLTSWRDAHRVILFCPPLLRTLSEIVSSSASASLQIGGFLAMTIV